MHNFLSRKIISLQEINGRHTLNFQRILYKHTLLHFNNNVGYKISWNQECTVYLFCY